MNNLDLVLLCLLYPILTWGIVSGSCLFAHKCIHDHVMSVIDTDHHTKVTIRKIFRSPEVYVIDNDELPIEVPFLVRRALLYHQAKIPLAHRDI